MELSEELIKAAEAAAAKVPPLTAEQKAKLATIYALADARALERRLQAARESAAERSARSQGDH